MAHTVRFVMVGGFLGAGKTTTLARLARHYMTQGLNVGIVTNDQAADLVDTKSLRSQGFDVGEVAGACFCCRFDDLISTIDKLGLEKAPDLILAEPVGSCTDLVATVVQPIRQLYQSRFQIAPYGVILKPSQGRKILKNEPGTGFSPKAAYILQKQLEEADLILVNRIDELSPAELTELHSLLDEHFPNTPRLAVSAKTGTGFDGYFEFLDQEGEFGRRVLDIDYDVYAEGEAELGWLNSSVQIAAAQEFPLDQFLVDVIAGLKERLVEDGLEVAHLKVIGLSAAAFGVANLVSRDLPPELSLPSHTKARDVDLVVNARVACDPELLGRRVEATVREVCASHAATPTFGNSQMFRPGRPQPTHRMAAE
ncbi:MAG: cobalamin biosynthesis protein P47K [Planctomycetes bacterium]|nr:cobalamin biosynthesis protein P47K [Planctomycetota bacterium]